MTSPTLENLVSVVVPTFNRARMLPGTLTSLAEQTYRPIEILVVDDGSTDETELVVEAWGEAHVASGPMTLRYLRQTNSGGNPARNAGIAAARGDYIAFLDSDDRWLPDKLRKQMAVFQADGRIGGVYCGVLHVDAATGRVTEPAVQRYRSGQLLPELLVKDVTAPTSTYVVKKEAFEKVGGFDTELLARQDWDMWIRLAAEYRIGCVAESLVEYRHHSGTRTNSNPQKEIAAYGRIMEKYASLRMAQPWRVRRAAEAAYYRRMGRVHFHHGISTPQAVRFYARSLMAWPFAFDTWAALAGVALPSGFRQVLHRVWNRVMGRTCLAIRSH